MKPTTKGTKGTRYLFETKRNKKVPGTFWVWISGYLIAAYFLSSAVFVPPAQAMARKPKTFPIEIKVDFGPAGKPSFSAAIEVEKGTAPKEAVAQVLPVLLGKACCSLREILSIDSVSIDPAKNRWWICRLNGSKKVSPSKTKLKRGDYLEWVYLEDKQ